MEPKDAKRNVSKPLWIFPKYTRKGASSRLRLYQYLPQLQDAGFDVHISPLFDDAYLENLYSGKRNGLRNILKYYVRRVRDLRRICNTDVVLIQGELFPWLPAFTERFFLRGKKYILDFDDAIFHRYDLSPSVVVRTLLGWKIDRLMQSSSLIIAGNSYLADRARNSGARQVEWLPTVIDIERYPLARFQTKSSSPVVGWIGTPVTWKSYGKELFEELSANFSQTNVQFVVIGAKQEEQSSGNISFIPWSEKTETQTLAGLTLGLMPLEDTPWAQGKCGYKLIQYLACGTPVIASPIGANRDIVTEGQNGLFAKQTKDWASKVSLLISEPLKCRRLGMNGRKMVCETYSVQSAGPRLVEMLEKASQIEK